MEHKFGFDLAMICAHRGLSEVFPENSLAAFNGARQIGVNWIETDVQVLADGVLVLFHDETLQRTSSLQGRLCDLTWPQFKHVDIGSWKSEDFSSERPLRMADLLEWQQSLHGAPNIVWEIKIAPGKTLESVTKIADEVCSQLKSSEADRYCVTSFNRDFLREARRLNPTSPMALSSITLPKDWREFCDEYHMQALHLDGSAITKRVVHDIKSTGRDVRCFTINERKHAQHLFEWGVDMIFTDDPRLYLF